MGPVVLAHASIGTMDPITRPPYAAGPSVARPRHPAWLLRPTRVGSP